MDAHKFDAISRLLSERRLSRRQALLKGGTGLAASTLAITGLTSAAAQNATPAQGGNPPALPPPADQSAPHMLYIQSFQEGAIAPKAGAAGTWTVTLKNGPGQTIYFSDHPDRFAGAVDTPAFHEGLGFSPDDPPNAALLFKNADGNEDITTVELFNPGFDAATHTTTYDVKWLKEYQQLDFTLQEAPEPPADASASFGAAHLFIDGILDCPDHDLVCYTDPSSPPDRSAVGRISNEEHGGYCVDRPSAICYPCKDPDSGAGSWQAECNRRFEACNGNCRVWPRCTSAFTRTCDNWPT